MKELQIKRTIIGSGTPKICVPLVAQNKTELLSQLPKFHLNTIDIIEWRIDYMDCIEDTDQLLALAKHIQDTIPTKPLLITFRTQKEGGEKAISTDAYLSLAKSFAASGYADLIDLELFCTQDEALLGSVVKEIQSTGTKVIFSNHDFNQTPEQAVILERLQKMQALGGDIAKIAVMPTCTKDVLTLLDATREMTERYAEVPIVTMSMGKLGVISRLSGATFGSAITFGSLTKASAPGQIPVADLANILSLI